MTVKVAINGFGRIGRLVQPASGRGPRRRRNRRRVEQRGSRRP